MEKKEEQLRIVGVPGPSKQEIMRYKALESALEDMHGILDVQTRGLLPGSVIAVARKIKGDLMKVQLRKGGKE